MSQWVKMGFILGPAVRSSICVPMERSARLSHALIHFFDHIRVGGFLGGDDTVLCECCGHRLFLPPPTGQKSSFDKADIKPLFGCRLITTLLCVFHTAEGDLKWKRLFPLNRS